MSEIVLAEVVFSFGFCLAVCLVVGAIHGFLLARDSKFSTLIPLFFISFSILSMLTQGWADYSAKFTTEYAPYAIIGCIIGMVLGEFVGWKKGSQ